MKPDPADRARQLFDQALELNDSAERQAFLQNACGDDAKLLAHVQKLLAAHSAAEDLFPTDPGEGATQLDPGSHAEGPGSQIGKYKLLQQIGEGGMGVVYLAEEQGELRRKVAFKIIKLGMDTKSVVARFEAERQALALMDHRNIAKVFDAGATDTGRPFFVMELVKGIPITEYCDKQKLTVEQRLELFIPVCEAIQHAHHKGIIHRDIKPSNVLVAHFDGKPVPLVIDFGIAKATHQRLTEKTQWTEFGQFIGTPAYVSPEQAEGSQLDIDTRSDLYSLGVLLYELLTGSQPFPDKRLRSAGWREMQRIIREEEPPRPSTRLSTLNEQERTTLNKSHPEGLGRISLILRRELDWIVMKCLEKDRQRRYETANGLALDIGRYLKGEAIVAVPPSKGYLLGKLVRKHKKTFAAAAAIAVILAGATVFSTWQAYVANRERAIATAVGEFLNKDLLQAADVYGSDPFQSPHRDLRLLEVVDRASTNLHGKFTDQPVVEASIRLTLGKIFIGLGEWPTAQEHLDRALSLFEKTLGAKDERVIETKFTLGRLLGERFELDAAKALYEEVLEYRIARLGSSHPETLEVRVKLAAGEYLNGRYAEAEDVFNEILSEAAKTHGEDHELVQDAKGMLGEIHWVTGRRAEAAKLVEAVFRVRERTLGNYHLKTLRTLDGIAWGSGEGESGEHFTLGTQNELEGLLIERVENNFSNSLFNAWIMSRYRTRPFAVRGLTREVSELRQRAYELGLAKAGPNHPESATFRTYQGFHAAASGDLSEAIKIFEEVAEQYARMTPNSMNTRVALYNLAEQYRMAGRWEDALATAERWKAASDATVQPEHSAYLWPIRGVAFIHIRLGDWDKAAALYSEVLKSSWKEPYDYSNAAILHALSGKRDEALRVIQEGMRDYRQLIQTNAQAGEVAAAALVLDVLPNAHRHALLQSAPDLANSPHEELILGLAAFRRGDLELATRWLTPLAATSPDACLRIVAGYFSAIVLQRQERQTEARSSLSVANRLLQERLKNGITAVDFQDATRIGLCLLARDEAETAIHGPVTSEPVDAGYLSRERKKWEPVDQLLRQANEQARRQRWADARRSYLDAMGQSQFSWEAAEIANLNPLASMRDMAARVFILSGDQKAYRELCGSAADPEALAAFQMIPVSLSFTTTGNEAVVFDTRRIHWQVSESDQSAWREALRGFNDYARSDDAGALPKFAAAHANVRYAHACTALAMSAAAHARLGSHDEARRLLAQAEARWSALDENHPGDWYNFWPELALCQIALAEGRKQLAKDALAER